MYSMQITKTLLLILLTLAFALPGYAQSGQSARASARAKSVGGTGTAGTITKWLTPTELGDSVISEDGGNVAIGQPPGTNSRFRVFLIPEDRNGANAIFGTLAPSHDPDGQTTGSAVTGFATNQIGSTQGVKGVSYSNIGIGVFGATVNETGRNKGVLGSSLSTQGIGVEGVAGAASGATTGVRGESESDAGTGVYGVASHTSGVNYGVFGESHSPNGYAGYFVGNVHVDGNLSKASGSFRIDHPLDPENKYLSHSFVESPDMMNLYNGLVRLDEQGAAEVRLPDYFEALNRDFRYQLTCVGGFAPVYVAGKVRGNRFRIAGGKPGMEVSWQVTGVRQDAYAEKHRIAVEEVKPAAERGYYLHPEAYGQPEEKGVQWARAAAGMKRAKLAQERSSQD